MSSNHLVVQMFPWRLGDLWLATSWEKWNIKVHPALNVSSWTSFLIATKVSIRAEKPVFRQCSEKLPLHLPTLDFQGGDLQPNYSSRLKATDKCSQPFIMSQSSQQISCLCHFLPAFKKAWGFPGDSVSTTESTQCNYWGLCTLEPSLCTLELMLNKWSHWNERPRHCSKELPLLAELEKSPHSMKTHQAKKS